MKNNCIVFGICKNSCVVFYRQTAASWPDSVQAIIVHPIS